MIILYDENNEIGEIEEDGEYIDGENTTASETDAVLLHVSQAELDEAVEILPKMYDLFSFWFLMWLMLRIYGILKTEMFKNTSEMRDRK